MGKIRVLDVNIANLIAAGEVVDRPASVVKELMENSIDAKSTMITVEIKRGGVSFIRITDDGCGIGHDDVPIAIQSHATSKIQTVDDLDAIMTLGFRGEALASITAVSKLRIMTKRAEDENGTFLTSEQGIIQEVGIANTQNGTTIIVEELFFNVPARRKFLKSDMAESMAITAVVEKIALSHPEISVRLIIDNNIKFSTSGDGKLQNTIYAVLGREFSKRLIAIQHKTDGIALEGFIGAPDQLKSNRNAQNFFINGRYIKSRTITAALEQAFHSYIPSDKFPCCVLNLYLHPALVDVNVHPAKLEVKFSNERMVFDAVYSAVRSALLQRVERPQLRFGDAPQITSDDMKITNAFTPIYDKMNKGAPDEEVLTQVKLEETASQQEPNREEPLTITPQTNSVSQATAVQEFAQPTVIDFGLSNAMQSISFDDLSIDATSKKNEEIVATTSSDVQTISENSANNNEKPKLLLTKNNIRSRIPIPQYQILGIAFHSYLFVEVGETVLVIDKHAAHERILFEQMKEQLFVEKTHAQIMFIPYQLPLSPQELVIALEYQKDIEMMGYFYTVSENALSITELPTNLTQEQALKLLQEFLSCLQSNEGELEVQQEIMYEKVLYQASCKAAMKAGRNDDTVHLRWICDQLLSLPDIKYCPHGRPVAFELSKQDLERQFKRT